MTVTILNQIGEMGPAGPPGRDGKNGKDGKDFHLEKVRVIPDSSAYTKSGNLDETSWGGSNLELSNYHPNEWKISGNLENKPLKTNAMGKLPSKAEKQSFKPQCDETHIYALLTKGQATGEFINNYDIFADRITTGPDFFQGQGEGKTPIANPEWSFDHGEGLYTTLVKYDKTTMEVVASKSMLEITNFEDVDGLKYPRPYVNKYIDPSRNVMDTGYSSSRGPVCLLGDYIYLYSGTAYHTAVMKIRKSDLSLVTVTEIKEGLVPELINGLWGKNILVIPPNPDSSITNDHYPKLLLFTNSHMQYEFYGALDALENYSNGRLGFNSKVFCFLDKGNKFEPYWEFDCGPRMLKPGDLLPEASFTETDDFMRIWYNCANLVGKKFTDGSNNEGASMVPKTTGVNRVILAGSSVTDDLLAYGSGNTVGMNQKIGSDSRAGYIDCSSGVTFNETTVFPVFVDYRMTSRLVTDNSFDTDVSGIEIDNTTGEISVTGEYLIHIKHPFMIKLFKSGAGSYVLDIDEAHSLNYYGGGIWSPISYDKDSETVFFGTGNAQHIPLEDEIRMMRASLIATKGQNWVNHNVGDYGDELDPWVGSFASLEKTKNLGIGGLDKGVQNGSLHNTYLTSDVNNEPILSKMSLGGGHEPSDIKHLRKKIIDSSTAINNATKSPRQRRHLLSSAVAINARDGALKWGITLTPQDIYAFHQNLLGYGNDRLNLKLHHFTGSNADNACGVMLYTTDAGNRRGFTAWKSGGQMVFDLDRVTNTIGVQGDTSVSLDEGVTIMDTPNIVGTEDPTTISHNLNTEGWSNGGCDALPLALSPPTNYWGHCASDGKYIYTTRVGGSVYSHKNNILCNPPDVITGEVKSKYLNGETLEDVKAAHPDLANVIFKDEKGFCLSYSIFCSFLTYNAPHEGIKIIYSVYDASNNEHVWDVLETVQEKLEFQPWGSAKLPDNGLLSTFGATLLPGNIMSVGMAIPDLVWMNLLTGKRVFTQKFNNGMTAYAGTLLSNGALYTLPVAGKFFNPTGGLQTNRYLEKHTPDGVNFDTESY